MLGNLTLDILGQIVKKIGYEPVLLNPKVLKKEPIELDIDVEKIISDGEKEIILFSADIGNIKDSLNLAGLLSKKIKNKKIIFGGPQFDMLSSKIILKENSFIDYVLVGYAEKNLESFLRFLHFDGKIEEIPGIFYRENQEIKYSPIKESLTDKELDSLPIPLLDKIKEIPVEDRKKLTVPIRTSVGCNGACSFCYLQIKKWAKMSSQKIIDIFSYYLLMGFRKFLIVDDNFVGTDQERIIDIANGLIKLKKNYPDLSFEFDARPDSFGLYTSNNFNHNLIEKLIDAGLKNIFVGIESGNLKDLKFFRKSIGNIDPLQQNIYFLKNIKKHNVLITPGFILLNENSSLQQIIDNINFIANYLPPQISPEIYWYKLSYYAGSQITYHKIKELESINDIESIKKIIYGNFKPIYKNRTINNFLLILEKTRNKFENLEEELGVDIQERMYLFKKIGNILKEIHKKFFLMYINLAKTNNFQDIDKLVTQHYSQIRKTININRTNNLLENN